MICMNSIRFSVSCEERQEFLWITEVDMLQPVEGFPFVMKEIQTVAHGCFQCMEVVVLLLIITGI